MASLQGPQAESPLSGERRVALTNWTRLKNAPLLLPRASAVYWNDYLVILTGNGKVLLYNEKLDMWSMLPKFPRLLPPVSFSMVLHNNTILIGDKDGCVCYYDQPTSAWKEYYKERIELNNYSRKGNIMSREEISSLVMISHEGSLYAAVESQLSTVSVQMYQPQDKWSIISDIGKGVLHSAAVVGGQLFVHAVEDMKKITLSEAEARMRPKPPSLKPPPTGASLCCVKDTLFSFGGRDQDNQPTSDVLRYNRSSDSWESAGYMRSSRYNTTVVTVQGAGKQELLVIGGSFGSSDFKMTPSAFQDSQQPQGNNSTCIMEKCTVD